MFIHVIDLFKETAFDYIDFLIVFLLSLSLMFILVVSLSLNCSLYDFIFKFQLKKKWYAHLQTPLDCNSVLSIQLNDSVL